jgi:hypothetical protein
MMRACRRAPDPIVRNLHTKPAIEHNRRGGIAADEIYLVEYRFVHGNSFKLASARR